MITQFIAGEESISSNIEWCKKLKQLWKDVIKYSSGPGKADSGSCGGEALVLSLAIGYSTSAEAESQKNSAVEYFSPLHSDSSSDELKPFGDMGMGDAIALPSLSSSKSSSSTVKYNAFGPSRLPAREEFSILAEYCRRGVPNERWGICDMNVDYSFIPSYPRILVSIDSIIGRLCGTKMIYSIRRRYTKMIYSMRRRCIAY